MLKDNLHDLRRQQATDGSDGDEITESKLLHYTKSIIILKI